MPPRKPCPPWASPCIFSLTLTLTSKNLETQRSRHTDSPLFRSASRYDVSMHFAEHDLRRLERHVLVKCILCMREGCCCYSSVHRRVARHWICAGANRACGEVVTVERKVAYRLYISETMSISASAAAIFCSDESWGRPPPKRKDIVNVEL
jgi:hypothetical protein